MVTAKSASEANDQYFDQLGVPTKAAKKAVALRIDAAILEKIDGLARKRGISRNSLISYLCSKGLENE